MDNELIFARKIYLCAQLLGAQSDLLSTISSWRQGMSDEEVIGNLDIWINSTIEEQQKSITYVTKWHRNSSHSLIIRIVTKSENFIFFW
ncbi:MAG: hypothetical protein EOP43_02105 [Sphingobacteriaceae bacterium]|nr:MAG: hypothetical protein EOP43_02105 [Sphingobacteriaceae bacterium]